MKTNLLIKKVAEIISEEYDSQTVQRIMAQAQQRYEELTAENSGEPKALKSHTLSRIYPGIALYESMVKNGIQGEKAVWFIREYFQRMCLRVNKMIQGILKFPGLYHKLPRFFTNMCQKGFSPEAGFEYRFPQQENASAARFDIIKCPYLETCKRYGCPELTKAFCDSDDASYAGMHQNLLWGRTGTMGHGQDCCDFRLTDIKAKSRT